MFTVVCPHIVRCISSITDYDIKCTLYDVNSLGCGMYIYWNTVRKVYRQAFSQLLLYNKWLIMSVRFTEKYISLHRTCFTRDALKKQIRFFAFACLISLYI